MSTEAAGTPAKRIAAGYAVEGKALELGTVVVDGQADPTAQIRIPLATVNRHGLVAGATGTGKTKTLQLIAEQLQRGRGSGADGRREGRPVRAVPARGEPTTRPRRARRTPATTGTPRGFPVEFLSLGTEGIGVPVRATIASFGPVLLSKVLGLNALKNRRWG